METPEAVKQAISEAQQLLRQGQTAAAQALLRERLQQHAHHDLHLNLAMAHRLAGELEPALRSLNDALAMDPYSFLGQLSKASVLEQMGRPRLAAEVYRNALKLAPPEEQTPPGLKAPITRAREVVAEQAQALAEHLHATLGTLPAPERNEHRSRLAEAADVLAGTRRVYHAEPVQLHYPRLPAIPFFEREYFPWMPELEAATGVIQAELQALLDQGLPGFAPYVQYAPGTPENQFRELNHSSDWQSLWLWRDGEPQRDVMAQCPQTTAVLEQIPMADQPGFAPTALFSALAPRTRIPPHTGSTNTRLLVHLPLVLPGPAGFRVGNETRAWRMGEAWAFDDTIEHEAWNDADSTRVIMIFDIWNPLLSEAEREQVSALLQAQRRWLQEA